MNTDTCPDCSSIPCDCGLPAGYTPTPRTDFAIKASNGQWNFVLKLCSERLERELTAAREEIKETQKHLKDVNRGAEINAHALRINADKLIAVTEQLKQALEEMSESQKDYKCLAELLNGHDATECRMNLVNLKQDIKTVTEQRDEYKAALQSADNHNHEIGTKLEIVTEQRERLADLVKQFIYILDITEESDGGRLFHPTNITSCRAGDLQKAGQLVEALRRAAKGGNHES